ncbi:MAG: hypothetical protein WBF86_00580, partial [Mycobacterium sp.]
MRPATVSADATVCVEVGDRDRAFVEQPDFVVYPVEARRHQCFGRSAARSATQGAHGRRADLDAHGRRADLDAHGRIGGHGRG